MAEQTPTLELPDDGAPQVDTAAEEAKAGMVEAREQRLQAGEQLLLLARGRDAHRDQLPGQRDFLHLHRGVLQFRLPRHGVERRQREHVDAAGVEEAPSPVHRHEGLAVDVIGGKGPGMADGNGSDAQGMGLSRHWQKQCGKKCPTVHRE